MVEMEAIDEMKVIGIAQNSTSSVVSVRIRMLRTNFCRIERVTFGQYTSHGLGAITVTHWDRVRVQGVRAWLRVVCVYVMCVCMCVCVCARVGWFGLVREHASRRWIDQQFIARARATTHARRTHANLVGVVGGGKGLGGGVSRDGVGKGDKAALEHRVLGVLEGQAGLARLDHLLHVPVDCVHLGATTPACTCACGVGSIEQVVGSIECIVSSIECGVGSIESGVGSIECE